jgi:farnesyl diphosphate synthase
MNTVAAARTGKTGDAGTGFETWMQSHQARIESVLESALPGSDLVPERLHRAMRYAVLNGGKRIRPLLVYAAAELVDCPKTSADGIAAALELIHAYSLVHDDMPCMDNDVLRRGKPTVWKAFDEATAMLVGDALQSLAFQALAQALLHTGASRAPELIVMLAQAAGSAGMCGGQQIDLASEGQTLTITKLERLHRMKTGALLQASVVMPALAANAPNGTLGSLESYGQAVGLAFQVADDVLDATVDSAQLGKTAGKDAAQQKATYATLLGLDAAREKAENLRNTAHQALARFGDPAARLRQLADLVVDRTN